MNTLKQTENARPVLILTIIGLLPIVMVLGNSMFIPVLPFMQAELGISTAQAGLILTIFSVPSALFIPVSGLLSDRYGRRNIVMVSLVIVMLGCIISGAGSVFQSFEAILAGRFIQGIGAGGVTPIAMVLAAELFQGDKRNQALASIESFNGVGKVISPVIGGAVLLGVWYYSFVVYLAAALLAFMGFYLVIPKNEAVREEKGKGMIREAIQFMKSERNVLMPIFLASGAGMFLLFGFLFLLSYEWEGMYSSNGLIKGLVLAVPLLLLTVCSLLTGKYALKNADQIKRCILTGLLLFILVALLFIFTSGFLSDLLLTSLLSIGLGFLLPGCSSAVAAVVNQQIKGMIFSVYSMVRFLGVAFGPYFFGVWLDDRMQMSFNILLLAGVTCVVLVWNWTCLPIGKTCETHQTS